MNKKMIPHKLDQMTPVERRQAILEGKDYDRIPCVPFMSELKCYISGVSVWDFWNSPEKAVETEVINFNKFGYDRIVLGPDTRGITELLGAEFVYPKDGVPYMDKHMLTDYSLLSSMDPFAIDEKKKMKDIKITAEMLSESAKDVVPLEASIGGPLTIASNLRNVELLFRDCVRNPEEVHKLLRIIVDAQKHCIDIMSQYGMGIAMADPVANSELIGPRLYEKFVFPYTKELTEYAIEKTGKKVSLHMCGKTYVIWKYLAQYQLNEVSLDNIIDMQRAVDELGIHVPIAGNVPPVEVMMKGTKEDIYASVYHCANIGYQSKNGFMLTTGCDLPEKTAVEKVDYFMEAVRSYGMYDGTMKEYCLD